MKDRDEAWMRVEALAMRHPNYNMSNKGTTNNLYTSPQHIDNSPPDEDGDTDQTPLTLEKIEAKANEVWHDTWCRSFPDRLHLIASSLEIFIC